MMEMATRPADVISFDVDDEEDVLDEVEGDDLEEVVDVGENVEDDHNGLTPDEIIEGASSEVHRAFAIRFFSSMFTRGMSVTEAEEMTADVIHVAARTIRQWRHDLEVNGGKIRPSRHGKNPKFDSPIAQEEFKATFIAFVRAHAVRTDGTPNLRILTLTHALNAELLPNAGFNFKVSEETTRRWLHTCGFSLKFLRKGIYNDGHERPDVVEDRKTFLKTMLDDVLPRAPIYNKHGDCYDEVLPVLAEAERSSLSVGGYWRAGVKNRVIVYNHDESTFAQHDAETSYWKHDSDEAAGTSFKTTNDGQKVMVGDFVNEGFGFLRVPKEKEEEATKKEIPLTARCELVIGKNKEGFFDNDQFIKQVMSAMSIHDFLFPNVQAVFLFDHSGCHFKFAEDALIAERMNVGPDGSQPCIRDTTWAGKKQVIGRRGLREVLIERGLYDDKMTRKDMVEALSKCPDFASEVPLIERIVKAKGHRVVWIPKYHPELNYIELVWGRAKKYARRHCDHTLKGLRATATVALAEGNVPLSLHRSYARVCRDFMRAYREGKGLNDVKKYSSHRRVFVNVLNKAIA